MKILYRIIFLLMLSNVSKAQGLWKYLVEHPDSGVLRYDTTYVKPLLNQLTLRYFLNVKQMELAVSPVGENDSYDYKAGDFVRYGFGFGYRWLILNASYAIDPLRAGPLGEKSIRHFDIQMNIFGRTWLYDLRTQWYRGFQYKNTFRPDLSILAVGGSLRYNFNNKKYSFKNTYDQTQWQIKSAGSPIAGVNVGYTLINSDSSITFGNNTDFRFPHHETYNIAAGAGYSYTYVYKKHWFATYTITMYLDNQFYGSSKNFLTKENFSLAVLAENRFGFGYNSHKIYVGIQGTVHHLPGKLSNNLDYTLKYNNLKLLFIHRLNFNPYNKQ